MIAYLARRMIHTVILVFVIITIVFLMVHLIPGDPAIMILGGEDATPSAQDIATVRSQLGLDKPLYRQYGEWLGHLTQLDLGTSFTTHQAVTTTLVHRLPRSLMLGLPAVILAALLGVPLGIAGARLRETHWDPIISAIALLGFSVPVFVTGVLLVLFFAVDLGWLPSGGYVNPFHDGVGFLKAALLPILALAMGPLAVNMRMTRSSVLEELGLDYVRTARAKGLAERPVILAHVLRNSLLPVITVMGLQIGGLFSGSILVEFIFNWPGIGQLFFSAISQRDYPVVQGVVLIVALAFVLVNLLTDISYAVLDPRIRFGRS